MRIHEVYLDPADKYRVRVAISDDEAVFFKFQEFPTVEMVQSEVDKLLAARAAEFAAQEAAANGVTN